MTKQEVYEYLIAQKRPDLFARHPTQKKISCDAYYAYGTRIFKRHWRQSIDNFVEDSLFGNPEDGWTVDKD